LRETRVTDLHSAADSIGLCLLLFTQLFLKVNALSQEVLALTWNSHSRSYIFAVSHRPTRGSISPYNIAGLISEVSKGAHFCRFIQICAVGSKRRIFSAPECVLGVQCHPSSM